MKKVLLFFSIVLLFACSKDEFLVTDFYVKNTSNKTISFDASILKRLSDGYHEMSLPFVVYANDSVLARRTEFSKDGKNPHKWFRKFTIHPMEGIQMNDPNLPENWIKFNTKDNPVYVFTLIHNRYHIV